VCLLSPAFETMIKLRGKGAGGMWALLDSENDCASNFLSFIAVKKDGTSPIVCGRRRKMKKDDEGEERGQRRTFSLSTEKDFPRPFPLSSSSSLGAEFHVKKRELSLQFHFHSGNERRGEDNGMSKKDKSRSLSTPPRQTDSGIRKSLSVGWIFKQ